jgi:hypothetical protein
MEHGDHVSIGGANVVEGMLKEPVKEPVIDGVSTVYSRS